MPILDIRPYHLRAHIAWLDDSGERPHIAIANGPATVFPPAWKDQDMVVFNIDSEAVQYCNVDADGIAFMARFKGQPFEVRAPLNAIQWVASQNGTIKIPFPQLALPSEESPPVEKPVFTVVQGGKSSGTKEKPHLYVVPKTPT